MKTTIAVGKYLIGALAILLAVVSCSQKKSYSGAPCATVAFDSVAPQPLSDYFPVFDAVQLETNDECLISKIKRIEVVDGKLAVLSGTTDLFIFDKKTGKFLNRIGNKGEGPEDYSTILDFYIGEGDKVCIVDPHNRVISYDLQGNYLSTIKADIPFETEEAVPVGSGHLLTSNKIAGFHTGITQSTECMYSLIDYSTSERVNFDEFAPVVCINAQSQVALHSETRYEDGATFFKFLNDTIFHIDGNCEIKPAYKLDLPKPFPSKEDVANFCGDRYRGLAPVDIAMSGDYFEGFESIFETDKLIYLETLLFMKSGFYWIDKESGKGFHVDGTFYVYENYKKLVEGTSIMEIVGSDEKRLIASPNIKHIKGMLDDNPEIKPFNEKIREIANSADPEGNPVLFIYEH